MFATDDSIVAIATPPGHGGIGVVRLSGPAALTIAAAILEHPSPLRPRHATFTRVSAGPVVGEGAALDEVIATYFNAPHSYTGQDIVEISGHGSPVVLQAIVRRALDAGARLAAPGEFTLRAFLNGKRDLIQAEAVADLVAAATPQQARVAFDQLDGTLTRRIAEVDGVLFDLIARLEASLDFPDEGFHFIDPAEIAARIAGVVEHLDALLAAAARGRMIREGGTVVIAGRTNVGKSSVFNTLAGVERAIVTSVHGTTRDLITESVDIGGLPLTLVDTAGVRDTLDVVEREGVSRGVQARTVADLLLVVLDRSEPLTDDDRRLLEETSCRPRVVVSNKSDLPSAWVGDVFPISVEVSAVEARGFAELRDAIVRALTVEEPLRETVMMSNTRHVRLVEQARAHLSVAGDAAAGGGIPEEFILTDLQAARRHLDEIVGARTSDDVLNHIFERFCIGK